MPARRQPTYRVTEANRANCNIDAYVEDCGAIWPRDVDRPVFDIFYHIALHASKIGEALRRELYDDAFHELGRTTVWLFSFINKLNTVNKGADRIFRLETPLSRIIWNKFPNCCPSCFGRWVLGHRGGGSDSWKGELHRCDCLLVLPEVETRNQTMTKSQKQKIKNDLRLYAKKHTPASSKSFGLEATERRFADIFNATIFSMSIETIGFHLLEEVGEIADALGAVYTYDSSNPKPEDRQKRMDELEGEIADAFSWLLAVSTKLRYIFALPGRAYKAWTGSDILKVDLTKEVWLYNIIWLSGYGDHHLEHLKCRDCGKPVCECPFRIVYDQKAAKKLLPST